MAGRFMKIKKVVIPFMTLVVMTSQLAGCATMSSDEMLKTMQESPEVSIEYATPDEGEQIMDASKTITVGDQQFVSDSDNSQADSEGESDIGMVEQQEAKELSGDELHNYFQLAYDSGTSLEGDLETRISGELDILVSLVGADDSVKLPGGYADQYRAWRPAEAVDPFTEVNETVYATGTVNLRSGPSTAHDKVGSLNKSDSVTRVGIGTAEAEGWSRIQLSDGSLVYVSNKYLSTTKPVVQQQQTSKPSGGGNTTTQGGGQQQTPPQQQTSGSSDPDMAEIEQAMMEQLLKDREEAKANGANFGEGDPLSNEAIEKIGEALNTGLMP